MPSALSAPVPTRALWPQASDMSLVLLPRTITWSKGVILVGSDAVGVYIRQFFPRRTRAQTSKARRRRATNSLATMTRTQNERARYFRSLHQPGKPLILMNVYDPPSARAVAALPSCKALATASYAIAEAAGLKDEELTWRENQRGIRLVSVVAREFDLPLTADLQGGYGDSLESCIKDLIDCGVVGCNLEDVDESTGEQYDVDTATERIRRALKTAADCGVPDFVINARVDTLLFGGEIEDVIARGRQYLAAGASTAFVWGGRKRGGISKEEVVQLSQDLEGRLNVSMRIAPGNLTVDDLSKIGVARASVGPQLQLFAMEALKAKADQFLRSDVP